ncbi:MAG: Asp-tRNA(Asn)/Glu-tRNA(Gln) amidotransferase subunit GatC [Patescibacteria group bacterium]|jgi:aspartyl-tRNA(Asn)/glutamyl-tRNA(Gln) amidotransferase subunit C
MSKLSIKEIEHIAALARLELKEEDEKKFAKQLSSILSYVDRLSEVETDGILPIAQVTGLENVWRDDEVVDCSIEEKNKIFDNFPTKDGRHIKVRGVFEE